MEQLAGLLRAARFGCPSLGSSLVVRTLRLGLMVLPIEVLDQLAHHLNFPAIFLQRLAGIGECQVYVARSADDLHQHLNVMPVSILFRKTDGDNWHGNGQGDFEEGG
jgi:hypothetical protein